MKLTLLQIVQDMLASMDTEEVSSVGDTGEAGMCIQIANRAYEEMIERERWKHLKSLVSFSTTTALNEMVTPLGTIALDPDSVYYSDAPIRYLSPEYFLDLTIKRDTSESNITSINNVKVYTDRDPLYFTSFNDQTLVFDAIPDPTNGLLAADTVAMAYVGPTTRLTTDAEVFNLPRQAFPALEKLCISMAKSELQADTAQGQKLFLEYKNLMAALGRNARLVDRIDDRRKWIVPRKTRGRIDTRIYKTA